MHQDGKHQRRGDLTKFKEYWFLMFMLLFTLLHNFMVLLMGDGWSVVGYSVLFLLLYGLFRWMRRSVAFLRRELSWGALIGFYLAGVFVFGSILVP
ncbi:hypothetical protein SAMN04487936_101501 [Halobacillus dabanensis]|uniref:Uncharacterized protein n=1 Tax=Halobacillus dabanensis TaxID=240302 RepID=A0A1I3Q1C7_HALDA|nr:hypothetical protein [Halobacillus dabanensis]SFJ27432.1 hypothetical protein SAMN04487936_101501 [Halobacillus dabanensis]